MIKIFTFLSLIMLAMGLHAQSPQSPASKPPLGSREVSGIVRDNEDNPLPGAIVKLKLGTDSVSTATNEDGIFVFRNVKLATFVLSVRSIGFKPQVRKMLMNDAVARLVLDPIVLQSDSKMLNAVVVNGTPSVVYKTDTVEYRAADYKVRENATVDELLKKMEGMEVGTDGSVTHQGQQVTKARLNGKDFSGGDVAQAIQNLPADIVEKIQIVDDYGEMAARTGVKDGEPQKVLNIFTRADRSVGTTGRMVGQYGSDDRYNAQLNVQRINANQQLSFTGRLANTINGVASTGILNNDGGGRGGNSGPGISHSGSPSFGYRDQWGKKVQVVTSYRYNFRDNQSWNDSYGQRNSTRGPSNFINKGESENNSYGHNVNAQIDYTIDASNFLQITPSYSYSNQTSISNSMSDQRNWFDSGFEHQVINGERKSANKTPQYDLSALYVHMFKNKARNLSMQMSITQSDATQNGEVNNSFKYYADTTLNNLVSDSLSHLLTSRGSNRRTLKGTLSYREPISLVSSLEFTAQYSRSNYDNAALSDSVLADGSLIRLDRLSNIYDYSFTESRLSLNYRYSGQKFTFSAGARAVPYSLSGHRVNNSNDGANVGTSRNTFRVIPLLYMGYQWSRTQRLTLRYTGTPREPNFDQIQPFVDRTDPNNIVIGNPDLKPTFTHTLDLAYNNYFPNSKMNISINLNGSSIENQVASNVIQFVEQVSNNGQTTNRTINQTNYVNLNGAKSFGSRYNFSKQFGDRRYNLSLNGNVNYNYGVGYSNNQLYNTRTWRFNERFGPRLSPTDNIEINPYIAYDLTRNFNTLPNATQTEVRTTSLAIDGKFYFLKTNQFNYSAAKSFVSGYGRLGNPSPFVINAGFEREFLKRKNLVLTVNVYDILHENNFVQQTITSTGYTNTLSNTLSRYFLVGVRYNLQKWSGEPMRNGRKLQRRGDGSFTY